MLACFFMVLGQLSLRKIAPPNPRTNINPNQGALFLGDNGLVTFSHNSHFSSFLPIVATI